MRATVRRESRTAPRSDCDRATERVRADRVPQIQAQQQHPPRALLARCVAARGGGGDLSLFAFVPSRSRIRSRDRPRAAHHASSDRLGPRAQYVLWQHAMLAGVVLLVNLPSPPLEVFSMAKTILLRRVGSRRSPYIKPLTAQSRMAKWQMSTKQSHELKL